MTSEREACTAALRVLDEVLGVAVERQAKLLGPATLLDPWRGMHLDQQDVQRLLERTSNAELLGDSAGHASVRRLLATAARRIPSVGHLAQALDLHDIDIAALLVVLAPDVDLRYERIYAYLQDDVSRKRPSIDLIANLLATDTLQRLEVCARFRADTPLLHFDMLVSTQQGDVASLARSYRLDEPWLRYLLGEEAFDPQLADCARFVVPQPMDPDTGVAASVTPLRLLAERPVRVRLLLQGPHGAGKFRLAQAVAFARRQRILLLDLRGSQSVNDLRRTLRRADRLATLAGALLCIHGFARLEQADPQMLRVLVDTLAEGSASFVLATVAPLPALHAQSLEIQRVELSLPDLPLRRVLWERALARRLLPANPADVHTVAARFALSAAQIEQAAAELHVSASETLGLAELSAAARAQSGFELSRMAQRIVPQADFTTLVAPEDVLAQLREICARMHSREFVRSDWANSSVHARSLGVTALFIGSSGTGKTLSAEAVARELGFDLYRIDLAGIVSKYIGETEKNLDRVFAAAEHANAVLFFDEADALFGKRSEVKDAHDRYANIEVAYLLQKMEQFDGLAILATNLKQNLDEAFARRLTFTVNFPFPEALERRRLWETLWPSRAPRAADVDLDWFANEYRLSGGNIRNTIMAAAHLAAANGKEITRADLLHATRREFQKLGKNLVLRNGADAPAGRVA